MTPLLRRRIIYFLAARGISLQFIYIWHTPLSFFTFWCLLYFTLFFITISLSFTPEFSFGLRPSWVSLYIARLFRQGYVRLRLLWDFITMAQAPAIFALFLPFSSVSSMHLYRHRYLCLSARSTEKCPDISYGCRYFLILLGLFLGHYFRQGRISLSIDSIFAEYRHFHIDFASIFWPLRDSLITDRERTSERFSARTSSTLPRPSRRQWCQPHDATECLDTWFERLGKALLLSLFYVMIGSLFHHIFLWGDISLRPRSPVIILSWRSTVPSSIFADKLILSL